MAELSLDCVGIKKGRLFEAAIATEVALRNLGLEGNLNLENQLTELVVAKSGSARTIGTIH
jgi:hypothetical protein